MGAVEVLCLFFCVVKVFADFSCPPGFHCLDVGECYKRGGASSNQKCSKDESNTCCTLFSDHSSQNSAPDQYGKEDRHHHDHSVSQDDYRTYYQDGYRGPPLSYAAWTYLRNYEYSRECGIRRTDIDTSDYRYESSYAHFGEFPWHVALLEDVDVYGSRDRKVYKYHCGATLISSKHLITAAHCIRGTNWKNLVASLGDWNLHSSRGEMFPSVKSKLASAIIHKRYDPVTFKNNLALLTLNHTVDLRRTPHIVPICISGVYIDFKQNSRCFVAGWGREQHKTPYSSSILKATRVSILKQEDCVVALQKSLQSLNKEAYEIIEMCFRAARGQDTCVGDGGSAVICSIPNNKLNVCGNRFRCQEEHYFLAGVISWGSGCNETSATVVTPILRHVDWIVDTVKDPYNRHGPPEHAYKPGSSSGHPHNLYDGAPYSKDDYVREHAYGKDDYVREHAYGTEDFLGHSHSGHGYGGIYTSDGYGPGSVEHGHKYGHGPYDGNKHNWHESVVYPGYGAPRPKSSVQSEVSNSGFGPGFSSGEKDRRKVSVGVGEYEEQPSSYKDNLEFDRPGYVDHNDYGDGGARYEFSDHHGTWSSYFGGEYIPELPHSGHGFGIDAGYRALSQEESGSGGNGNDPHGNYAFPDGGEKDT